MVKTVSVDLVKPLGEDTWDAVGQRLRDLRGCSHRLVNAGIRAAALGGQANKDVMAAARAGVKEGLASERDYWREKIGKAYEGSNHDPERAARLSELALPSVIEDHTASRAAKKFLDARKHMARGDKSIPSEKGGAPIYLRDGSNAWKLERDEGGWSLSLKLFPGRSPMVRFAVRVHSASAHADLRRIVDDTTSKLGDARIIYNERARQWEARLCYSFPKPKPSEGTEVLAVHRGMRQFLTLVDSRGIGGIPIPGDAWRQAKVNFSARRRSLMRHIRKGELGHGARGRGVQRRYKALNNIDDAEARMMKAACQQAAALVVGHAQKIGAGVVLIEDYQTIREERESFMPTWPWAQLKTAVTWACQKVGIEIREVPADYISVTCPACQNVSAEQVRDRVFGCANESCGLGAGRGLNVDTVAALNMLRLGGVDCGPGPDGLTPAERMIKNARALAASMRRGQQAAE